MVSLARPVRPATANLRFATVSRMYAGSSSRPYGPKSTRGGQPARRRANAVTIHLRIEGADGGAILVGSRSSVSGRSSVIRSLRAPLLAAAALALLAACDDAGAGGDLGNEVRVDPGFFAQQRFDCDP